MMANEVVVGVLETPNGKRRLMECRANENDPATGHWEHPSGAVEPGEDASDALGRVLRETLGIEIEETEHLGAGQVRDTHQQERIWIEVYRCKRWKGEPAPQVGQQLRWMTKSEATKKPCSESTTTVEKMARHAKKRERREERRTTHPWITLMFLAVIAAALVTSIGTTAPSKLNPVQISAAGCPIPSSTAWAPIRHVLELANAVAGQGHCRLLALEVLRHHLTIALAVGASAASLWGLAGGPRRARRTLPLSCLLIMLSSTTAWIPWS